MRKGRLIVFTGIDGSGKTTQANLLTESLKRDGLYVSYVWSRWEPFLLRPLIAKWKSKVKKNTSETHNHAGKMKGSKQRLLSNPFFRWMWLGAFFIDYGLQIFKRVRMKLFKEGIVISDRIFYDSVIDQAVNLGDRGELLLDTLDSLWARIFFPKPDMVIYIDCPEDIAFSRKNDGHAPDIEYLVDRKKLYLKLADKYNWIKIDGTLPVNDIAVKVRETSYRKLGR